MARRLFTLCSAASLLLCAAVCALWVRSYSVHDCLGYARNAPDGLHRQALSLESAGGRLWLSHWSADYTVTARAREVVTRRGLPADGWLYLREEPGPRVLDENSVWRSLGFHGWFRERLTSLDTSSEVGAPHWAIALACGVAPAVWLRRMLRRRASRKAGLCPACGYDLRASPEGCPECGMFRAKRGVVAPPGDRAGANG